LEWPGARKAEGRLPPPVLPPVPPVPPVLLRKKLLGRTQSWVVRAAFRVGEYRPKELCTQTGAARWAERCGELPRKHLRKRGNSLV